MRQKITTVLLAFIFIFLAISMISLPEKTLQASTDGLNTWWTVVFPSLLPFFIGAELLIRFGVVKFIGVIFEPIMRPFFNVPGIGSFAWLIGMASGFPSGAKITALLWENKQITQLEGERLVSFTNAASPLFIFGAIAVGLFHLPEIGIVLALSHYIGNIFVGFCMKFYRYKRQAHQRIHHDDNLLIRAFQGMHRTRLKEKKPIGEIIGESVQASVQTLLMIGGFIILFSVLTTLLQETNIASIFYFTVAPLFHLLHFPVATIPGIFTSLFEITLGADMISEIRNLSLTTQLICISFMLGFNGFSIHAQVASILANTTIRYQVYLYGRILHAIFSSVLCLIFTQFMLNKTTETNGIPTMSIQEGSIASFKMLHIYGPAITMAAILIAFIFLAKRILTSR